MEDIILIGKLIMWFLILVALALFLGNTEISINPFYIKVTAWRTVIGWLAIFIGFSLVTYDIKKEAYEEGHKDAMKELNSIVPSEKLELEDNKEMKEA